MRHTGNVYKPGREWEFDLKSSHSLLVRKMSLIVLDEPWALIQTKIKWSAIVKHDDGSFTVLEEFTGVIDNTDSAMKYGKIWIHPPRFGDLQLTELVPFPEVRLPLKVGQTYTSNLTPGDGWGDLKGVNMEGHLSVSGKVQFKPRLICDSCWVIDAVGKSSKGVYSAPYYFHSSFGFVYMKYNLGRDTLELSLVRKNFT